MTPQERAAIRERANDVLEGMAHSIDPRKVASDVISVLDDFDTARDRALGEAAQVVANLGGGAREHEIIETILALRSNPSASPSGAMEWRAITKNDVGKTMLVTNNLHAQNARGDMSHKWIGWIQESNDPKWGDYICFDEADRRITGLTHCAPIPAPPRPDQAGEGKGG